MPEEITRERVIYRDDRDDSSSDEYYERREPPRGGFRTVQRYRVTPSRVEPLDEYGDFPRRQSTFIQRYREQEPFREPRRESVRNVVYRRDQRGWEPGRIVHEPDIRIEPRVTVARGEQPYRAGPPPPPPASTNIRQRHAIRRAATLPVRFDQQEGAEGATVFEERDTESYRRPTEIERSPSPVRIRERIIERERSSSPLPLTGRREIERSRIVERTREDIEGLEIEAYSFAFSRHRKNLPSRDSTLVSIPEAAERSSAPPSPPSRTASQAGKVLLISGSRYTGDGSIGGSQSADVTFVEDATQPSRKGSQPVFRWV